MSTHKATKTRGEPADFEKSLASLNRIIEKIEGGSLSLDESLKYFEEGIALIRGCQKTLAEAEQKVQILTGKSIDDFKSNES